MLGIKLTLNDDSIRDIVGMANMPLLLFDQYWLALFPKEHKNSRILACERRIIDLMKKEARIREKTRILSEKKQQAIEKIQSLTAAAFTYKLKSAQAEMKKCRRLILKANAHFLLANYHLGLIEDEIGKVNRDLLEETIKICYAQMHESKARIDYLEPKLENMRKEVKDMTKELEQTEIRHENTYNLLHKLVGPDVIDRLDKERNGEKRRWF